MCAKKRCFVGMGSCRPSDFGRSEHANARLHRGANAAQTLPKCEQNVPGLVLQVVLAESLHVRIVIRVTLSNADL